MHLISFCFKYMLPVLTQGPWAFRRSDLFGFYVMEDVLLGKCNTKMSFVFRSAFRLSFTAMTNKKKTFRQTLVVMT